MKNFRKLLVFIISIIFCSCANSTKEDGKPVETVRSQLIKLHFSSETNQKNTNISLAFLDIYGNRVQYDHNLGSRKQYDLTIQSKGPIFLKDLSFKQTSYLMYPGETLTVKLDSAGLLFFKTVNRDTIRDNELNFFNSFDLAQSDSKKLLMKSLDRFPGIAQILSSRKVEAFLEFLLIENADAQKGIDYSLQKYKDQVAYLNLYGKVHLVSDTYKHRMLNFFLYEDLKLRLSIINNKLLKDKESSLQRQIPEIIRKLNCDSCLYLPGYKEAIQIYVKLRYSRAKDVNLSILYEEIKASFSSGTRDFALFTLIKHALAQNNADYKKVFNRFKNESKLPLYFAYLQDYDKIKNTFPGENTMLMQTDGKLINLEKVLNAHLGKVVLLDFWASWCIPCKAQMPYSEKLEERYKNNDVRFIYLSLDEHKSAWEASNKQLNLSSSYLIVDNFKSSLSKKLAIKTIPRYILIDKTGKISNKDAPRPNDNKLAGEINVLLKKPI